MRPTPAFLRPAVALLLALACALAGAQPRPRIERAADLPRFSYRVDGRVEELVRSPERFAPFAAQLRRDVDAVLSGYEIPDKATRRNLLNVLALLDYLQGDYDAALARIESVRQLQDKPADKLLSGLRLKAMALAAKDAAPGSDAFRAAVAKRLAQQLAPLPYAVVENDVKGGKSSAELMGEALVLGSVREVMQPIVDRSGQLSSDFAPGVVNARFGLVAALPLKQTFVDAYAGYLAAHKVVKPDIWAARDVTLQPSQVKAPVAIGVWDSGVETRLFADRLVRDGDRPAVIAFDKYARPAAGELTPLPAEMQGRMALLTARTKGFSDLRSAIDSPEAAEVKAYLSGLTPERYRAAMEEIRLTGVHTHGTHVAGIALAGNPGARLVVARIEFSHTLRPDPCPSRELAERDAAAAQADIDFMKRHGARVVNMSWSSNAASFESDLEKCGIGHSPDERRALAREYFDVQKAGLQRAFRSAPEILFVTSAGNSNSDATFIESIPGGLVLPNLLTVGAVDSAGDEAPFTSYGPTVKVHANGYQVESFVPGGSRIALSGTSMSSPQVANLAGKLLAVNPKLSPEQLIRLIVDTAERSPDGRRNLVDPKKALAAATAAE